MFFIDMSWFISHSKNILHKHPPNAKICEFIPFDSSENNFKVVWDTLQYLQRWKDSKIWYNLGFKIFKIYNISPKNAFIKFHKGDKK